MPTLHSRYSLSAEGHTLSDREALGTASSGTRCDVADGDEITVEDLFDSSAEIDLTEVSLGSRDGLDTIAARGGVEITENIPGGTITSAPAIAGYRTPRALDWPEVDWAQVEKDLSDRGVTLMLLWQEWRETHPGGMSYPTWCRRFRAWRPRRDATMCGFLGT